MNIGKLDIRSRKINLQTSKQSNIPNEQFIDDAKSLLFQSQLSALKLKFLGAIFKSGPSSIYNCHGMTFANRRTGIYEVGIISKILVDDCYVEIRKEDVLPGDIVLYYSSDGDIEHSGIVTESPKESLNIPFVVSKWGEAFEVIHSLYICPYSIINIKFFRCEL
jgi:hypothetical protein